MAWTCYHCGTKNPNSAAECQKCGGTVAAPRKFYVGWVFGGAVFFYVFYLLSTFLGGTISGFAISPSEADVVAAAQAQGMKVKSILDLQLPDDKKKANDAALAATKARVPRALVMFLYWILPFILFPICGVVVGFVSSGRTVLEAVIGSVLGQVGGYFTMVHAFDHETTFLELGVGVVVGIGLAAAGAWLGEAIQQKLESGR